LLVVTVASSYLVYFEAGATAANRHGPPTKVAAAVTRTETTVDVTSTTRTYDNRIAESLPRRDISQSVLIMSS
jgi:hypothetical protein